MEIISDKINERDAAARLNLTVSTLRKWRLHGRGPSYYRIAGRAIRYSIADLDGFMAAQRVDLAHKQ